jgi:hypothetical protein
MGLYRTKPNEVEAIQFLGTDTVDGVFFSNGTAGPLPAWLWKSIASGAGGLSFDAGRLFLAGDVLVAAGEWIVVDGSGVMRVCADDVFKSFYTPARKRLYGDTAETEQTETSEAGSI